ncbi:acyl-homoserine-lactone synthase [Vibrio europaeus]|uniref:acyl-homoserine-lactone synthase n=1 Tax=Vibrio europaeus TaxID=300876 RepID=UPI0039E13E3F
MTLLSKLISCLEQDTLRDTSQKKLFHYMTNDHHCSSYRDLFESLINKRRQMVLAIAPQFKQANLRTIYLSQEYQELVNQGGTATSSASKYMNEILEKVAVKHFGSLSQMWALVEVEQIVQRQLGFSNFIPGMTFVDQEYQSQLIDDVEKSQLIVSSPHREGLFKLSDAICLANIDLFVLEQSWYELLPLLGLSAKGSHFVLLHAPNNNTSPCLASSAKITGWSNSKHWLSYTPFFQHKNWQCLFTDESVNQLNKTGAFKSVSADSPTLKCFDQDCIEKVHNKSSICEILRLTTAGQKMQRLYLLYLAQKEMANCLYRAGFRCAYTIIDNPWLLNFYSQLGSSAYIDTGCYSIEDTSNPTFRGMWLVEEFNFQYSSIDFRQYKKLVRSKVCKKEVNDA